MEDNKIKIFLCGLLAIVLALIVFLNYKTEEEEIVLTDAQTFKEEYESLNGTTSSSGSTYISVSIDSDNIIKYATDIEDILEQETAVVYFGFASCPWCRNLIEPLLEAASNKGLDTIYYVDIKDIRDTYELNDDLEVSQTKEGTDEYYKILDFLGTNLSEYYLTDDDGNTYDTGVTRLYAPTVIAVKEGELVSMHVGTVESQTDPYTALTDEESSELVADLEELISSIQSEVCNTQGGC